MKIHNKLFFILFTFSLVLVASLVLMVQWSIGKGMVNYVNKRELETLQPLINGLQELYQQDNSWESLRGRHRLFQRMLFENLSGSEFMPPESARADRHSQPIRPRRQSQDNDQANMRGDVSPNSRASGRPPQYQANQDRFEQKNRFFDERNTPRPKPRTDLPPRPRADQPPRPREDQPPPHRREVSYALLDAEKTLIVGVAPNNQEYVNKNIIVDGEIVGYFAVSKRNQLTKDYELDFIEQQREYLWLMALAVMLFVIVVTLPLARHLVVPIRQLMQGMHKLTQGNYQQNLDVKRKDEFGELNRDFNELANTLDKNETARRRWLANISHELRTPVAILRGELEAMLDNVRPLTIENITSATQEVMHLQRLIEDLHQLTSADVGGMNYRKENIVLNRLLQHEAEKYVSYLASAGLTLTVNLCAHNIEVFADRTRLCQLFDNLMNNCVKYASSGHQVNLTLKRSDQANCAVIIIEDDGPGVNEQHLSHLFEHLYRVDDSRNRSSGGTGLGLSICAHIIEAHHGKIIAERSTLGGLAVTITLPLV
ncbi:ATP-binding protein [Colwelliaceae bacterium 6471]